MDGLMKALIDFYLIDTVIGALGIFMIALVAERYKALFITYSMNAENFMTKVLKLVEDDKTEEAITLCGANDSKPLAHVIKRVLEKSDRDDQAIDQALDIAAGEVAPKLSKNLAYIAMVSNVVTLVGLLGTVVGLIMSFKAVSFADPSQKQTLLADGIAVAMHATALALLVAIPSMVLYSFLHAKQGKLFSEIDVWSMKTIELIKGRGLDLGTTVYPTMGYDTGDKKVKIKGNGPVKSA
jgi:biopolymer transport protein ExbB